MTIEQFERKVNTIPHLYTERHAKLIYGLVRWLQPEVCVEVGSYHGYVSAWIARGIKDNGGEGILFCMDNFTLSNTPQQLHNHLAMLELSNLVQIIGGDSADARLWPNHVDFAFIDGNHSTEYCFNDVKNCVLRGAKCVVIHDVDSWWGPREFIVDKLYQNLNIENCIYDQFDGGLAILMTTPQLSEVPENTMEKYPKGYITV